jgi:hypothetical protein
MCSRLHTFHNYHLSTHSHWHHLLLTTTTKTDWEVFLWLVVYQTVLNGVCIAGDLLIDASLNNNTCFSSFGNQLYINRFMWLWDVPCCGEKTWKDSVMEKDIRGLSTSERRRCHGKQPSYEMVIIPDVGIATRWQAVTAGISTVCLCGRCSRSWIIFLSKNTTVMFRPMWSNRSRFVRK